MPLAAADLAGRRNWEAYAEQYRLALPERHRAERAGELGGRLAGSSIEYQDRKDYVAGDDVRHVDWRAFARNDRLTIKLYRQEISPVVDIVIDASQSMAVSEAKRTARTALGYFFSLLARRLAATQRIYALGERLDRIADPLELLSRAEAPREDPLPLLAHSPLTRPGGIKVAISDFLFPCSPRELLRPFASADRIVFIQVLSAFEADPEQVGELRLEEAETGRILDLALDRPTVEGYKRRLAQLQDDLRGELQRRGGTLAIVRDNETPAQMIRTLLQARVVEA